MNHDNNSDLKEIEQFITKLRELAVMAETDRIKKLNGYYSADFSFKNKYFKQDVINIL